MQVLNQVLEQTTTEGTATYELQGALTGFQTFVESAGQVTGDVTGPWSNIAYVCVDGVGGWEIGEGTLTDASPDTLSRALIIDSSNAGSAVSWSAGTKKIYSWPGASVFNRIQGQTVATGRSFTKKDVGLLTNVNNAAGQTMTVEQFSTMGVVQGSIFIVRKLGAGNVTIAAGAGVTLEYNTSKYNAIISDRYEVVTLRHGETLDTWELWGGLQLL